MSLKRFIIAVAIFSIFLVNFNFALANEKITEPCIHLFYKEECPQCSDIVIFLSEMEKNYPINIEKYQINEEENKLIYNSFKERYGLTSGAYPLIFIGDNYLIGNKEIKSNLEKEIIYCQNNNCVCPLSVMKSQTSSIPQVKNITPEDANIVKLPLVGEINFSKMPIFVTTAIIAFVDGFNPCSLWLITFLIGIVIYTRSKKKLLIVGATFLLVTGIAYALFMAGLLNVFSYVGYLKWIQLTVAIVAGLFALVNIKDYFWYKKGISFTISDKYKPKIFKDMRGIMKGDKSIWQMIVGTAILALGVVLIELPCTAGFPVVWTNILAQSNIEGSLFYSLLVLYMLIYLLDEVIILLIAAMTMKVGRFEEKHGRILKLIGGMIMLSLAFVMIIDPNLMHNVGSTITIFLGAIALSFIILLIHRKVLPKFGIKIGSEKEIIEKEDKNIENNNMRDD